MNENFRNVDYYFKNFNDFPFPEIFEVENVWDILNKKDDILRKNVIPSSYRGMSNVVITGPVYIGKGTEIKPFTVIEAEYDCPIYIGNNCKIGPHAYIRKGTLIGDCVEIGRSEVKGSVIQNGVKSHHHGYIGDSILGTGVNIGTSFDSGNLKHTNGNIRISGIDTGLRKFGCVIGDYSKLGCKTTTLPGTLIGPNVWIDSDLSLDGFISENTFRKRFNYIKDGLTVHGYVDETVSKKYRRRID